MSGKGTHWTGPDERVSDVRFNEDSIIVDLMDGRTIAVPLAYYPRLLKATPKQRAGWRITGAGDALHWPEIDEDLTADGMLRGFPAARQTA